ncbi:GNAT family N-acetyltransferase [Megalodesulfovibrio gigas]|uniref:Putative GCN5-related N-acetyltransferase n=1 Tax=Megalodesulfovibrio gigas (strain ATCC 19364 / DSM 1382 / NCIMB 9332 / VKM B-1759) TaxID=1121448 RepID=T2GG20_MEGG1|nr:GNAT family N-acetyltransferase [Megalodesulfovibrio gigas]AGW15273.1 putative GCN5-related N-acetyltransferase [Megalodesulfovibrio gigas DSM 1382 = ATCC 19364]
MSLSLRQADPEDAEQIARIVREVSGGVADYLLRGASLLVSPERLLSSLIMETGNPFSHEHVLLLEGGSTLAGLLLAYPWDLHGVPDILHKLVPRKRLQTLEGLLQMADANSLYINTIWVAEPWRGTGAAAELLECSLLLAAEHGLSKVSLHVWADNTRAVRFYRRHGFEVVKHFNVPRQRLLPHDGGNYLMSRTVDADRSA